MNTAVQHDDALLSPENLPLLVHFQPVLQLTDDQFYDLCQLNRELRIERTAQGELLIMPPTGWETSEHNAEISIRCFVSAPGGV